MKRKSDRKCVNYARVNASAQAFDRCGDQTSRFLVLTKRSAAYGDENDRMGRISVISFFILKWLLQHPGALGRYVMYGDIYCTEVYISYTLA